MKRALLGLLLVGCAPMRAPVAPTYAPCATSERALRVASRPGESWEDAGERLYGIDPGAWLPDGTLAMCDDYSPLTEDGAL